MNEFDDVKRTLSLNFETGNRAQAKTNPNLGGEGRGVGGNFNPSVGFPLITQKQ